MPKGADESISRATFFDVHGAKSGSVVGSTMRGTASVDTSLFGMSGAGASFAFPRAKRETADSLQEMTRNALAEFAVRSRQKVGDAAAAI